MGASTYGLEIVVVPLAPLTADETTPGALAAPAPGLRAVKPVDLVQKTTNGDGFRAYSGTEKAVIRSHFEVDTELGIVIETTTVERQPAAREEQHVKVR